MAKSIPIASINIYKSADNVNRVKSSAFAGNAKHSAIEQALCGNRKMLLVRKNPTFGIIQTTERWKKSDEKES